MKAVIPFTTRLALEGYLAQAQEQRLERLAFTIAHPLSSAFSDAQLRDALDPLLPLVQQRSIRLRRERGGDWHVTLHLRYRTGVRMADAYRSGRLDTLSSEERQTLERALTLVKAALEGAPSPGTLAQRLYDVVREAAVYENPPVGTDAYGNVISAISVLLDGKANCQGFADAFYLLGTLAGLTIDYVYITGRSPHLYNRLLLSGAWYPVDATRGRFPTLPG